MLPAKYGVKPECFVDTETFLVKKIFFCTRAVPHVHIDVIYSGRFPPSGDATSALRALQEHIPSLIKEKNTLKMVLERRNMV